MLRAAVRPSCVLCGRCTPFFPSRNLNRPNEIRRLDPAAPDDHLALHSLTSSTHVRFSTGPLLRAVDRVALCSVLSWCCSSPPRRRCVFVPVQLPALLLQAACEGACQANRSTSHRDRTRPLPAHDANGYRRPTPTAALHSARCLLPAARAEPLSQPGRRRACAAPFVDAAAGAPPIALARQLTSPRPPTPPNHVCCRSLAGAWPAALPAVPPIATQLQRRAQHAQRAPRSAAVDAELPSHEPQCHCRRAHAAASHLLTPLQQRRRELQSERQRGQRESPAAWPQPLCHRRRPAPCRHKPAPRGEHRHQQDRRVRPPGRRCPRARTAGGEGACCCRRRPDAHHRPWSGRQRGC